MLPSSTKQRGILAILGLGLILAITGLFARLLGTVFTPLQQVYLRVGTAFLLSIIFFSGKLNYQKLRRVSPNEWGLLTIRSLSTYLLGVVPFSIAVGIAKLSTVAFISALPIVAALGVIVLHEKLTKQKAFYILVGLLGVLLLSVPDYSQLLSWGRGELLALFSIIFISLSQVLRRKHTTLLNNYEISSILLFIGATCIILISFARGEVLHPITSWTMPIVLAVFGAGIVNVLYQMTVNYGFEKVEAVLANNLLTLSPFFSIILGFLFYSEVPSVKEWIAGAIIIASAYKMNKIYDQ